MADKTFRGRIEALMFNDDEAGKWNDLADQVWGRASRTHPERLSYINGFDDAKRDALGIAAEADAEIARITKIAAEVASTAMDPEIDPGLPLHERIAILKHQRDAFADFTEQVAALLGCEGESGSNILDALKATVDTASEVGNIAAERQRTIDDLRARLAAAEAELANLRGVPEQWRKACEERDAARSIAAAITGYPFDMLVGRYKADDAAASGAFHRTVRETLKYQDDERGFDLTTLNLGGDPPHGIEKAGQVDDFAGIMDGPEMMPIESDEEPRR